MSQYLNSSVEIVYSTTLIVVVLVCVTFAALLLVKNYLDHIWGQYAKNIDYNGFTGNSLELLRAVCHGHRLEVHDVFCCDHRTGELIPVTQHNSGDIFYQFELFNAKKVTLGEICNGCIFVYVNEHRFSLRSFRRNFTFAFNMPAVASHPTL